MKNTTSISIRVVANGYVVDIRKHGIDSPYANNPDDCHVFTDASSLGAFVTQFYAGNHVPNDIATAQEAAEASACIRTGIVDNLDDEIHNPDGLTDDVIGVADGWRLLRKSEVKTDRNSTDEIQTRGFGQWLKSGCGGRDKSMTYRTKVQYGKLDEEAAR